MRDQLDALTKRRIRLAAVQELVDRATSPGEYINALNLAAKTRQRIYTIEAGLPFDSRPLTIPARAGFGRTRLTLVRALIGLLDGLTWPPTGSFKDGDVSLRWSARADRIARIVALVPEFLADVDEAALEAARAHRNHLKTLPEEHHDPKWRESMVRGYRRDYMEVYGSALAFRVACDAAPSEPVALASRGQSAATDALVDVARADVTRYALNGPRRVIALPAAPS
ncbi:hypothetical protein [Streptosporangium roseum]|uniref:hypothetical protein n=1 Tax=Streptosporangium roseum TaxID=2001 RepID=UPI0033208160